MPAFHFVFILFLPVFEGHLLGKRSVRGLLGLLRLRMVEVSEPVIESIVRLLKMKDILS